MVHEEITTTIERFELSLKWYVSFINYVMVFSCWSDTLLHQPLLLIVLLYWKRHILGDSGVSHLWKWPCIASLTIWICLLGWERKILKILFVSPNHASLFSWIGEVLIFTNNQIGIVAYLYVLEYTLLLTNVS